MLLRSTMGTLNLQYIDRVNFKYSLCFKLIERGQNVTTEKAI